MAASYSKHLLKPTPRLASLLELVLLYARFDQLFHQGRWHRLVQGKAKSAFRDCVFFQVVLKLFEESSTQREETAMFGKCREANQRSLVPESRHPVVESFRCLRRGG